MPGIPTFGVPERISSKDAMFVVLAGIGLTAISFGFFVTVVGKEFDRNNGLHVLGFLAALGVGPAMAYYLARWLRANRLPLAIGCGGLVVWVTLLSTLGSSFGWLGVAILVAVTGLVMGLVQRSRGARDQPPA